MRRLQAEGVIRREAHRRPVVVDVNPNEDICIFSTRAAMEPIVAGLAMQSVDANFLDKLHQLHERMDDAIA